MLVQTMCYQKLFDTYREKHVLFTLTNGRQIQAIVQEIENELDGWDETLFMIKPDNPSDPIDLGLHEIRAIKLIEP